MWMMRRLGLSFNSQPPEGGWFFGAGTNSFRQSFNSQPPEGGWGIPEINNFFHAGFNSQPPEGGWLLLKSALFSAL